MVIKQEDLADYKGISIAFGYAIDDVVNGVMDFVANKAQLFPEEFSNLQLTEGDKRYITRFLKNTSGNIMTTLSAYATNVANAYQYDVEPSEGTPTSNFVRYEFIQHYNGDKNLFPIIDNHIENALIVGVVLDWFKFRVKDDLLKHLDTEYEDHINGIKVNFDKRTSPIRTRGSFF